MDLDANIKQLMVIAKIPSDGKLLTQKETLSIDPTWTLQPVWRWFKGESRDLAVQSLQNIYKESFRHAEILLENVSLNLILIRDELTALEFEQYAIKKKLLTKLYSKLKDSLEGFNRLLKTYNNLTDLSQLKEEIEEKIQLIDEKLSELLKKEKRTHIDNRNRPESIKNEKVNDTYNPDNISNNITNNISTSGKKRKLQFNLQSKR